MIPWRIRQALVPIAFGSGIFAFRRGFRFPLTYRLLSIGWANEGFSADPAYLEAVCRWAADVSGPILECGSGLSTILLGIVAKGRVTTLEHLPEWKAYVQKKAARFGITVNVLTAPLLDYGGFDWYSSPELFGSDFELVICDGPPSKTKGGRYGLFPVARRLFAPNVTVLMDDVECSDQQSTIRRWEKEFGVHWKEYATECGTFAAVRK